MPSRGERYSARRDVLLAEAVHEPAGRDDLVVAVLGRPLLGRRRRRRGSRAGARPVPGVRCGSPVKLGFSGQMPVSTTPITTPRPAPPGRRAGPDAAGPVEAEQAARAAADGRSGRAGRGSGRRAAWCCARPAPPRAWPQPRDLVAGQRRGEPVRARWCSGRAPPGRRRRAATWSCSAAQPRRRTPRPAGAGPVEPVPGRPVAERDGCRRAARRAGPRASRRTRPARSPGTGPARCRPPHGRRRGAQRRAARRRREHRGGSAHAGAGRGVTVRHGRRGPARLQPESVPTLGHGLPAPLVVGFDLDMTLIDTRPGFAATLRGARRPRPASTFDVAEMTRPARAAAGPRARAALPGRARSTPAGDRFRALYPDHAIAPTPALAGRARGAGRRTPRTAAASSWSPASTRRNARLHVDAPRPRRRPPRGLGLGRRQGRGAAPSTARRSTSATTSHDVEGAPRRGGAERLGAHRRLHRARSCAPPAPTSCSTT